MDKKALLAQMLAMGLMPGSDPVFHEPRKFVRSAPSQGRKCGQCFLFGKRGCKCSHAKSHHPACSNFKLYC